MDLCTLAALLACFTWGGVYVDGDVTYSDARYWNFETFSNRETHNGTGAIESGNEWRHRLANDGGRGRLAIGYELALSPKVTAALELARGENFGSHGIEASHEIKLSMRWHPFAR